METSTALNVVLDDLAASGPFDVTWCLGDLAAFGPRPLECVDVIRRLAETDEGKTFKVIGGNTDRYLIGGERLRVGAAQDEAELKRLAGELQTRDTMLNWSMGALDWENYKFLRTILRRELATNVPGYGVVLGFHAVPGDDEAFLTDSTPDELVADIMLDREGRLGIGGHTHRQAQPLGRWLAHRQPRRRGIILRPPRLCAVRDPVVRGRRGIDRSAQSPLRHRRGGGRCA
ncbi:MAG: metallophosphoesterase [Chloroflexi bacterium]|nr:metallophosphoesterase [Chloroflexota bacterium]